MLPIGNKAHPTPVEFAAIRRHKSAFAQIHPLQPLGHQEELIDWRIERDCPCWLDHQTARQRSVVSQFQCARAQPGHSPKVARSAQN